MGGVAKHLMHLYDDRDLTFNKIKKILSAASRGELQGTEKTDGFNIYLGIKGNKAVWAPAWARNKGDMKIGGRTFADLAARKFKGGDEIKKVYLNAFKAYERTLDSLSQGELDIIFGENKEVFYNAEIQGPSAKNIINYDEDVINIHHVGHKFYNEEKNTLETVDASKGSNLLDDLIDRFEEATSDIPFSVRRTAFLKLNQLDNDYDLNIALQKIQKAGFSKNMTIEEYMENYLRGEVERKLNFLSPDIQQDVLNRILKKDGAKSLTQIYKGFPIDIKQRIKQFVEFAEISLINDAIWPIEEAIHTFSVELLKGLKSAYILNNEAELARQKKEISTAIKNIQTYAGPGASKAHEILAKQLQKIKHLDNINTTVEGFVFQYGEQMYKFTGNFAPINQLLGLFKYGRGKIPPIKSSNKNEEEITEITEEETHQTLAIIPGAFKPPHVGHLAMAKHYIDLADKIIILISPLERKTPKEGIPITAAQSKKIWNLYLNNSGLSADVEVSEYNSPVQAAIEYGNKPEVAGSNIILGASTKGGDAAQRFGKNIQKYTPDVNILDPITYAAQADVITHSDNYITILRENTEILDNLPSFKEGLDILEFHGSDMRYMAELATESPIALQLFEDFMPAGSNPDSVLGILNIKLKDQDMIKEGGSLPVGIFLRLVEEQLEKNIKNDEVRTLKEQEEDEASEDAILDLSKEFDSGFCKYNPLINEYAQYSPDQLADVLMFVIGTQQMRWYDVVPKFPILLNFVHKNDGLMTDRNLLNPGEKQPKYDFSGFGQLVMGPRKHAIDYLWKNRESIYSSFSGLFNEYNNSSGLRKEEALFNIYLEAIKLPGLGLPKAAFATQLIIGRLGCIDSINLNIYKGISKEFNILTPGDKGFRTPSVTASGKKVIQAGEFDSNIIKLTSGGIELAQKYVEFLRQIAKETGAEDISRKLWDSWVELVAKKINIKDDLKVTMPDGSVHVVPNDYSKNIKGVETNPSAAFRKKYIGKITGRDVSRQHHIPTMNENKKDQLLFESWSKYFYNSLKEQDANFFRDAKKDNSNVKTMDFKEKSNFAKEKTKELMQDQKFLEDVYKSIESLFKKQEEYIETFKQLSTEFDLQAKKTEKTEKESEQTAREVERATDIASAEAAKRMEKETEEETGKEEIEEISTMGGGNVEGAYTKSPWPGIDFDKENERERRKSKLKLKEANKNEPVKEVLDYLLQISGINIKG